MGTAGAVQEWGAGCPPPHSEEELLEFRENIITHVQGDPRVLGSSFCISKGGAPGFRGRSRSRRKERDVLEMSCLVVTCLSSG